MNDRENQPRELPPDAPVHVQRLFDQGYQDWVDGRSRLRWPTDPIYMMGWEQASTDYAGAQWPTDA